MKIGPIDSKPVAPAQGVERKAAAGSAPPRGAGAADPEPSAQVALSPAASLLVKVADDPAFDAAKVERIAAAIREGKYQVNAEAIADKLIINAEELLGRKIR
ncbi:MAG: flagellar biosynthesis anti-sigma factor FlgM [Rubrivivax sp.]|nr:flagellar biosynthesis anti-sigma factor FlgM [Rubrivivax sp.]